MAAPCLLAVALVLAPVAAWAADDGSIEIGVTIAPRPADGLVATGVDPVAPLWIAGALIALGVATAFATRRTRAARPGSPRP